MKRNMMRISLFVFFASLSILGVTFTGRQDSRGTIVPSVQAADNKDADERGSCRNNCSLSSLKGCYGSTITGTLLSGPLTGPVAGVVLQNFDGQGGLTQVNVVSINGTLITPPTGLTSTGTYTVNPDCTGSITINSSAQPPQPPLQLYFVLTDGGREIRSVVTNPGFAATSVGRKQ